MKRGGKVDSTDKILNEFNQIGLQTESSHRNHAVTHSVIAFVLLALAGLVALSDSHPIIGVALFLSGLHFNRHAYRHVDLAEMTQHHRALAQLIVPVTPNLEPNNSIAGNAQ